LGWKVAVIYIGLYQILFNGLIHLDYSASQELFPALVALAVQYTGRQRAAAANNAAAAIIASQSKSHTAVGRCNKDEKDPCSQFPTKNAARIIALKEAGIPTSSTPIAQNITPNWEQYMYKNPNGSRTPLIVSHHPSDAKHPCPHWHVGTAKMDGNFVQKRNNGNSTFSWKYYKDNVTVQHRK